MKHGLLFHYIIIADTLLSIGCVDVVIIPCSYSERLSKLYSPWNRNKDNYNQGQYKGSKQKFFYFPILGSYNNW